MGGLTSFAMRNNMLVWAMVIIILITGPISFLSHPSREDPEIQIRTAVVQAQFPGMAPERVENLIATKLEESIRQIAEVETIRTVSRTGSATVFVELYERIDTVEPVWQDLRNKMQDLRGQLPQGTQGPFVNDDYGNVAMATIALTAEGFSRAEMRENARYLRDRLYSVPGMRKIELFGIEDERIFVEISNVRLAQYGLSATAVIQALADTNIIAPGGIVQAGVNAFVVEPSGNFTDLDQIGETVLAIPDSNGQTAYIRDIATISRGYVDPPENPVWFNGERAIVLSLSMVDQFDAGQFAIDLKAALKDLEAELPWGYTLTPITFQPDDIAVSINGVMENLYQTVAVVLAVVMIFLGWRTGLIVGAMVPLTMLLSILIMRTIEIDLERMSLATLIIALGLLVDNGTVIAEEIQRRIGIGEDRKEAAFATGRELALPLLSSSLTTILAFMPLMLAESAAGEYTRSISLVIAIALLGSWVIAMTLTPILCVAFIKAPKVSAEEASKDPYAGKFYDLYRGFLRLVLRFKLLFLAAVGGMMVLAVMGLGSVPKVFFPASERPQLQVHLDYQAGQNSYGTIGGVTALSEWLMEEGENPEVKNVVGYVASGGPRFYLSLNPIDPDPHKAFVLVNFHSSDAVGPMESRIRNWIAANLPDVRTRVIPMSLGPAEAGLIEYRIFHPDTDQLLEASQRLQAAMRDIPYGVHIRDDWDNLTIKLVVEVDQARAGRAGLTSQNISDALSSMLSGGEVTDYRDGDTIIPIMVRAIGDERRNIDRLRTLNIPNAEGIPIPLIQIATIRGVAEHPLMHRRNMERVLTVSGKSLTLTAQESHDHVKDAVAEIEADLGVRIDLGGELEGSSDAQAALSANMPLALGLIILILVGQFNSFRKPLIILSVIPLTIIGVTVGLLIAPGANFGFMAILGLLSLAGIIINNAIVLIDKITLEMQAGVDAYNAIINAAMTRFRPILVTTVTTVLGFMPIIVTKNVLFYDLGIVVVGGLILGTFLTLGVVPVLFALLFGVKRLA